MSKVGPKGNIVIDRRIRKQFGIKPGWKAIQSVENGRLVIDFLPPAQPGSAFGSLRPKETSWLETDEALEAAVREAAEAEADRSAGA